VHRYAWMPVPVNEFTPWNNIIFACHFLQTGNTKWRIYFLLSFIVGEGTARLGIVHKTKGQMYLALLPPSQYIDKGHIWQSSQQFIIFEVHPLVKQLYLFQIFFYLSKVRKDRERTKSCRLKRINWSTFSNPDNWHINMLFICPIDRICTCGYPKWDNIIENCFFQKSFGWTFLRQIKLLFFNEFILNFSKGNIPFCPSLMKNDFHKWNS